MGKLPERRSPSLAVDSARTDCSGRFHALFNMAQVDQSVKSADRTKTPSTWDDDATAAQGTAPLRFCDG
jgi:hypothetical protein